MKNFPKQILDYDHQFDDFISNGLIITDKNLAMDALRRVGYYRLRGYYTHLYNKNTQRFILGTTLEQILSIYEFDRKLSSLLFEMISCIEVTLRARLSNALLQSGDALAYLDPSLFRNKNMFWDNLSSISREVKRSGEVFVKHHYENYDGQLPVWAVVEVMSFSTLSKTIKNLNWNKEQGRQVYKAIAEEYRFVKKGKNVIPSRDMISSWVYTVSNLRNYCAHNNRIYNRSFPNMPVLLNQDKVPGFSSRFNGLYENILSMKYLRPNDAVWMEFVNRFEALLEQYGDVVELKRMNLPSEWKTRLSV